MKHKLGHKIKLFFLRKVWILRGLYFASIHPKELRKYQYLKELRDETYTRYLEQGRKGNALKEANLKGRLDILDHLLGI